MYLHAHKIVILLAVNRQTQTCSTLVSIFAHSLNVTISDSRPIFLSRFITIFNEEIKFRIYN